MRQKKPFYWTARKGWYLELNGKQVKLGAAESKTKNPPVEIMREYHRVMSGEGLLTEKEKRKVTVAVAAEAFVESKSQRRQNTIVLYKTLLEPFALRFKARRLDAITPTDVLGFMAGQANWGDSTRHIATSMVKGMLRWARDVGYLEHNPLASLTNPYPAGRRDRGISLDEFAKLIEGARDDAFRFVIRCLRDTGARPSELCVLSARHLHPDQPIATLKPHEHKTGGRTGKPKVIILPGGLAEELRELAKQHPSGPLLRNRKGDPWQIGPIKDRFFRLRTKLGLPDHVVPYASRHAFLTRLIEMGVPLAIAAKIAGHARTDTIMDSYLHPDMAAMQRAVSAAAGETARETPEQTIARLEAEIRTLRGVSGA